MVSKGTLDRRKAMGVCVKCEGPLSEGHALLCDVHRAKQNEANRRSTNKRRQADRLMAAALKRQGGACYLNMEDISGGSGKLHYGFNPAGVEVALCGLCSTVVTRMQERGTEHRLPWIGRRRDD